MKTQDTKRIDGWVKGTKRRSDKQREHYIYVEGCEIWVMEDLTTGLAIQIYLEGINTMTESVEIRMKPTLLHTAKANALRIRSQLAPF